MRPGSTCLDCRRRISSRRRSGPRAPEAPARCRAGGEKSQMTSGVSADCSYLSVILVIEPRGPLSPARKGNAIPLPHQPSATPSPLMGKGWGEVDSRPLTNRTSIRIMRRVSITSARPGQDFEKWSGTEWDSSTENRAPAPNKPARNSYESGVPQPSVSAHIRP